MKVLLDTHAFIWWDSAPEKLSPQARAACQDRTNLLLLSVASAWEMQIKLQLGKLRLRLPLAEVIVSQQQTNDLQVLPIALNHILALQSLPAHHKDPFDRLLIAQAKYLDIYFCTLFVSRSQQYQWETLVQNVREFLSRYLTLKRQCSSAMIRCLYTIRSRWCGEMVCAAVSIYVSG